MREECWPDLGSAEAEKIKAIQTMTGSQYLTKDLSRGTPDENKLVGDVAMKLDSDPGQRAHPSFLQVGLVALRQARPRGADGMGLRLANRPDDSRDLQPLTTRTMNPYSHVFLFPNFPKKFS